jgi:hypothetical protein
MKGGYRTIQHNEVRDVLAQLMKEAGHTAVETEPVLQPLHGEHFERKSANTQNDARSDIKCTGFWRHMRTAFFDIKVISPFAKSYVRLSSTSLYRLAENSKMREYAERIRNVEHADFNPLVFTTAGGMALSAGLSVWLQHLRKRKESRNLWSLAGYAAASVSLSCALLCFVYDVSAACIAF